MAMGMANAIGGSSSGGVGGAFMTDKVKAAIEAKKAAQEAGAVEEPAGNAVIGAEVQPHGDEAHTGGGVADAASTAAAAQPKPKKKGILRNIGGTMARGAKRLWGGLFYKMPASGAKYKNSPIEKNYGSPAQRGFKTPLELKTFGIGSLKGGATGKPRSKTGPGGKFND